MQQKILTILLLLFPFFLFSQGEANNWFFGNGAGLQFQNNGTVVPVGGGQIFTFEGCSSISSSTGQLLFYSDGKTVWDRNHIPMPNGNYNAGTGLNGDSSSTQSAIIIPKPGSNTIYYIFTVDEPHHDNAAVFPEQNTDVNPSEDDGFNNGLNYSVIDLSINGSNGSIGNVISRNNLLVTYNPSVLSEIKYKCSEKITAVRDQNGSGYWVLTHFINRFYAFKVSNSGVNTLPVVTVIDPVVSTSGYRRNSIGYLKSSPDGKKIAIAHNQLGNSTGDTNYNGQVVLYDFNSQTGEVTNPVTLITSGNPYGVEFSSNSKKLYVSNGINNNLSMELIQFDLDTPLLNSTLISTTNATAGGLQLGPDKKIYCANFSNQLVISTHLGVINEPNQAGIACDYNQMGIALVNGTSSLGLPPFISSVFNTSFKVTHTCFGETTLFELLSSENFQAINWDFGDGNYSQNTNPTHVYSASGNYLVKVTLTIDGTQVINEQLITISMPPVINPGSLTQCDLEANPDGFTAFNLNEAHAEITNNNPNYILSFYSSLSNAINNTNPLTNSYTNIQNPQTIHVRVTDSNSNCFTLTTLTLNVNTTPPTVVTLNKCDDSTEDGLTAFTLTEAGFETPLNTVSYYISETDALLELNPVGTNFSNTIPIYQRIYVRTESNNNCTGIHFIDLHVNELPDILLSDSKTLCLNKPEVPVLLDSGIGNQNPNSFNYVWEPNGETTPTITVTLPGTYKVTVTNSNNCSRQRTIVVTESNLASFETVSITDLSENNTVTVYVAGDEQNYLYSLDLPNGPFLESNYFENVIPGDHVVYIKNKDGCGIISENISVMGIPNFFTPNGDGINDTWKVKGLQSKYYDKSILYIYDRYGKLLKEISPNGNGWDGIYNGQTLPSTDYWYCIYMEDGRTIKGHFSLKR